MGARFILTHETAEGDHVGMQDRGKFPLLRGTLPGQLRRDIGLGSQKGAFDPAVENQDYKLCCDG